MAKKKAAEDIKEVPVAPVQEVVEAPDNVLTIKNPYLTVRVFVPGLEPYSRTGLRAAVLKTVRAWIRARGLTVQIEGTKTENSENAGEMVETDNGPVQADLRVYTFTNEVIEAAQVQVKPPVPRGAPRQKLDDGKEAGETPEAKAGETKETAPEEAPGGDDEELTPDGW